MFCARCHQETQEGDKCSQCGESPLLDGRYIYDELLGHGASGTTWVARAVDGLRDVYVVKEISLRRLGDLKTLELFEREARVLESLDHEAIPDYVDDMVVEDGRHIGIYIVQEFIDGQPLRPGERSWREGELLDFLEEMAGVLEYLGEQRPPVVHRDIKPSNLLFDGHRFYLIDFGVAALSRGEEGGSTVAGTFGYMAPEQLRGLASPASDVYGLGATALALAAGKDPDEWLGRGDYGLFRSDVALSEPFGGLLMRMVHPDRAQRIGTGKELRFAIEETRRALARLEEEASQELVETSSPDQLSEGLRKLNSRPEQHWLERFTKSPGELMATTLVAPIGTYLIGGVLVISGLAVLDAMRPRLPEFMQGIGATLHGAEVLFVLMCLSVIGVWGMYLFGPNWQARATGAPKWWPRWRRLTRSARVREMAGEFLSWRPRSRVLTLLISLALSLVIVLVGKAWEPTLRLLFGVSGAGYERVAQVLASLVLGLWFVGPVVGLFVRGQLGWRRYFGGDLEEIWPEKERRARFVAAGKLLGAGFFRAKTGVAREILSSLSPHSQKQKQALAGLRLLDVENANSPEWKASLEEVLAEEPSKERTRLLEEVAVRLELAESPRSEEVFAAAIRYGEESV